MSEAKHSQTGNFGKSPLLAEPISGLMTATCYDWPTSLRARHTKTTEAAFIAWLASCSAKERLSMWVP